MDDSYSYIVAMLCAYSWVGRLVPPAIGRAGCGSKKRELQQAEHGDLLSWVRRNWYVCVAAAEGAYGATNRWRVSGRWLGPCIAEQSKVGRLEDCGGREEPWRALGHTHSEAGYGHTRDFALVDFPWEHNARHATLEGRERHEGVGGLG